jgi:rhodanese-related sulfurtransferase
MRSSKDYLAEANLVVKRIPVGEAIAIHGKPDAIFIDVRDSAAIAKTGTIKGATRIPRGFIEFAADDASPYHNPVMKKEAEIYLVCGAGGQAALAGKTLLEMGYQSVVNVGGFPDWKSAGGPSEE